MTERLPNCCGIVEVTSGSAELKTPQMLLQVVALALNSRFRKGVVLLGTNGKDKYRPLYQKQRSFASVFHEWKKMFRRV
jgi:hypothetical protein